jgi:hypothetical protein
MPLDGTTLASPAEEMLQGALAKSGLQAIDRARLQAHKRAELERHPASWRYRHQRGVVLGAVAVLAGGVAGFMVLSPATPEAAFPVLFAGLALAFATMLLPVRGPARWEERVVEADLAAIHPVLRARVFRLQAEIPELGLRLGELTQDRIILDPYLIADYRGAEAVIGIWEGERLIAG